MAVGSCGHPNIQTTRHFLPSGTTTLISLWNLWDHTIQKIAILRLAKVNGLEFCNACIYVHVIRYTKESMAWRLGPYCHSMLSANRWCYLTKETLRTTGVSTLYRRVMSMQSSLSWCTPSLEPGTTSIRHLQSFLLQSQFPLFWEIDPPYLQSDWRHRLHLERAFWLWYAKQ